MDLGAPLFDSFAVCFKIIVKLSAATAAQLLLILIYNYSSYREALVYEPNAGFLSGLLNSF